MKMKTVIIFILVVLFSLTACKKDNYIEVGPILVDETLLEADNLTHGK